MNEGGSKPFEKIGGVSFLWCEVKAGISISRYGKPQEWQVHLRRSSQQHPFQVVRNLYMYSKRQVNKNDVTWMSVIGDHHFGWLKLNKRIMQLCTWKTRLVKICSPGAKLLDNSLYFLGSGYRKPGRGLNLTRSHHAQKCHGFGEWRTVGHLIQTINKYRFGPCSELRQFKRSHSLGHTNRI